MSREVIASRRTRASMDHLAELQAILASLEAKI